MSPLTVQLFMSQDFHDRCGYLVRKTKVHMRKVRIFACSQKTTFSVFNCSSHTISSIRTESCKSLYPSKGFLRKRVPRRKKNYMKSTSFTERHVFQPEVGGNVLVDFVLLSRFHHPQAKKDTKCGPKVSRGHVHSLKLT